MEWHEKLSPLHRLSDEEAVKYVQTNLADAKSKKNADITRNKRYENIYRALDPEELRINESTQRIEENAELWPNSYLPVVAARVDVHVCNLFNALFSTPDYLEIDAAESQDDVAAMKIGRHILNLHSESNFKYRIFQTLLAADIFDYAVTLCTWRLEPGFIPTRKVMIENVPLGPVSIPRRRIDMEMNWVPDAIDRPEVYLLDYFHCWHDWRAKNGFEDSEFFFDERDEPFWLLEENAKTEDNPLGVYKNIPQIKDEALKTLREQYGDSFDLKDAETSLFRDGKAKITRCFTRNHVVEICGDYVIRRFDTFDWLLQRWVCYELPGEFKGMGEVQRAERMQYDVNADLNSRRMASNWYNDPAGAMSAELLAQDEGKPQIFPGNIRTFSSERPASELFTYYQPNPPQPNAMQEMGIEVAVIDDIMHVGQNMLGNYSSGRRSATQTREVAAGGNSWFAAKAELIESNNLIKIYTLEFKLLQMLMTREARFKHYGKLGVESLRVTPEDYKLTGGLRFMAKGWASIQDAIQTQQFMTGMQIALPFPQYHKVPNLFWAMWKKLSPADFDQFVVDPAANRENIPPVIEHQIFATGAWVEPSPANDPMQHVGEHEAFMASSPDFQIWPNAYQENLRRHVEIHKAGMMQMAQSAAMAQQSAMGQGNMSGEAPGSPARSAMGMHGPGLGVTP